MGIFDSLPTLGQMPRGGWPKDKPEPSRLPKGGAEVPRPGR